jgi:hypothetical protein
LLLVGVLIDCSTAKKTPRRVRYLDNRHRELLLEPEIHFEEDAIATSRGFVGFQLIHTVHQASNVAPHGNFGPIRARSVADLDESCSKHEQNKVFKLKASFFYNLYSCHCSIGRVLMIANPSEKEVQSFDKVQS